MSETYDVPQSSSEEKAHRIASKSKKARTVSHVRAAPAPIPDAEHMDESSGIVQHSYAEPAGLTPVQHIIRQVRIEKMSDFQRNFPETRIDSNCALIAAKTSHAYNQLNPKTCVGAAAGGSSAAAAATAASSGGLQRQSSQKAAAADVSSSKRSLTDVQLQELHYDQSQQPLVEIERIRMYEAMMLKPQYHTSTNLLSDADATQLIGKGRLLHLPTIDADTESRLLRSSGTFWFPQPPPLSGAYRTFPQCGLGQRCCGMEGSMGPDGRWHNAYIEGLHAPIIFCRAMLKAELDALVESDKQPVLSRWPCVLCHRKQTEQLVNQIRMGVPHGQQPITPALTSIYQFWRNTVNEIGGYHARHVVPVREHEVVVAPLARFSARMLRAQFVKLHKNHDGSDGGFWKVTQDHAIFRAADILKPHIGETLQSFSNGASNRSSKSAVSATTPRAPVSAPRTLNLRACSEPGSSPTAVNSSMSAGSILSSPSADLTAMLRTVQVASPMHSELSTKDA